MLGGEDKRQGDGGQEKASRLVRGKRQDSQCVDHAAKPPRPGLGWLMCMHAPTPPRTSYP